MTRVPPIPPPAGRPPLPGAGHLCSRLSPRVTGGERGRLGELRRGLREEKGWNWGTLATGYCLAGPWEPGTKPLWPREGARGRPWGWPTGQAVLCNLPPGTQKFPVCSEVAPERLGGAPLVTLPQGGFPECGAHCSPTRLRVSVKYGNQRSRESLSFCPSWICSSGCLDPPLPSNPRSNLSEQPREGSGVCIPGCSWRCRPARLFC